MQNRRSCTALLLACALILHTLNVMAHIGAPAASDVIINPDDPQRRLITSGFGALVSEDGGETYDWVCDEAMQAGLVTSLQYTYLPNGDILAVVGAARRSSDGGCNWEPVAEETFGELSISAMAQHPTQRDLVYVSSIGTNITNRVFRSTDGAATFTEVLSGWSLFFGSIELAPSRPERVYVASFDVVGNATLHRSDDGGETFTDLAIELPTAGGYRVLGVHPDDPDVVFTAFLGRPEGALYRSTDGGNTAELVLDLDEDARQIAFTDDAVWLATTHSLYRSADGGSTFTEQPAPELYACVSRQGDALYACGDYVLDGYSVAELQTDGTWVPHYSLTDLAGPKACPADSAVATRCEPLWTSTYASIQAAIPGSGEPNIAEAEEAPEDCACSTRTAPRRGLGTSLGALLMAAGIALLRRRKA